MKSIVQNLKTGKTTIEEVASPVRSAEGVVVRNVFSVISAGTERSTVLAAKGNLLEKARARPDLVKKTLQNVRREGILATYQKVMDRLDTPRPMGYSCAGIVLEADPNGEFKVGDRVACGGATANHAEEVLVPVNLCARIPDPVDLDEAAFTTLGAIAMQGIRQAEVSVGERVGVIGLGLIGLLTVRILKASGCQVFGIDTDPNAVENAKKAGIDQASSADRGEIIRLVESFTGGIGLDKILITAAASGNEPVELSGWLARDRAILVIVGLVKVDLPRTPFYEKELEVRMSRSSGPGRYDPWYEEKGIDYPIGYVRWTEKRNMESFLGLVASGTMDMKSLITHKFPLSRAADAYDLLLGKRKERFLGILIEYPGKPETRERLRIPTFPQAEGHQAVPARESGKVTAGFIGAGHFAQACLLPALKKSRQVRLRTVCNSTGLSGKQAAGKFGFQFSTTRPGEIWEDPEIGAVFIATRHGLHGTLVLDALKHGKKVFVEKPLCTDPGQLESIRKELQARPDAFLQVGYNRRFSKSGGLVKKLFEPVNDPKMIQYRVNAGPLPKDHWIYDPEEGGGRIVGEVCHFIDFTQWITGSQPVSVFARALGNGLDSVSIVLDFSDGSVAEVGYFCTGDPSQPKERVEVHAGGRTAVLNNFETVEWYQNNRRKIFRAPGKGYPEELESFLRMVTTGKVPEIPLESQYLTSRVSFKILESLQRGEKTNIL